MSEGIDDLALKASSQAPWWATAPIYLSLGIIGVPALLAIGAGYFIASSVTKQLRALDQYNQSELHMLNEMGNDMNHHWDVVSRYITEDLRAQYQTCIQAARTNAERTSCITPAERERDIGITSPKDPPAGPPDP